MQDTVAEFGKLDVLVNNAAFQLHADSLEDITDERLEETFHTNIFGCMKMARAALRHLKRGGSIINTGSVTGLQGSRQRQRHRAAGDRQRRQLSTVRR